MSAAEIPPGGEGKIEVKVNTRGRRGKLTKTVTVSSNDPDQPAYTLTVTGKVEVIAGFEPQRVSFPPVGFGQKLEKEVKLVGSKAAQIKLANITSSKPDVVSMEPKKDTPGVYVVRLAAGSKPGRVSAKITADTGLEAPKQLVLPVFGEVSRDLVMEPRYVSFQVSQQQRGPLLDPLDRLADAFANLGALRVVRIRSLSKKPFKVLSVKDEKGLVYAKVEKEGQDWKVHLAALGSDTGRGELVISTDRSDQPELRLRYSINRYRQRPVPALVRAGGGPRGVLRARPTMIKRLRLKEVPTAKKPGKKSAPKK